MSTKYADIRLFYYKEGNDLATCIVRNDDGTMNVKESFQRHIGLLQASIDKLQAIHDAIPDNNTCKLDADTHHIGIYGDDNVVQALVDRGLVSLDDFNNEEDPVVKGLYYIPDYLTDDEVKEIIKFLKPSKEWKTVGKAVDSRKVIHYQYII